MFAVAVFIILENRSPQFTFPVVGLLVYLFFGRSWRVFSRENELMSQEITNELAEMLSPHLAQQEKIIEDFAKKKKVARIGT